MSGRRNVVFADNEIYHVFNRSTAGGLIFARKKDIERALNLMSYYRFDQDLRFSFFDRLSKEEKGEYLEKLSGSTPNVYILSYSLMPNHFHLLLKQRSKKGIQDHLSNFQNSFAKYFNIKNKRFGTLFQRPFKAKHVETEEQLLHISRYIHLNPVTAFMMEYKDLRSSNLTSFPSYLSKEKSWINTDMIIKLAGSVSKYDKFVENQIDYQRKISKIKHLLLD